MSVQPTPAAYCSQCGKSFGPSELTQIAGATVCAECKPVFLRRMQEGSVATELRYKGFWIRFVAQLIDGLVFAVVWVPIAIFVMLPMMRAATAGASPAAIASTMTTKLMLTTWGLEFLALVCVIVYRGLMVGRYGATLGKMAIGARIVAADGSPLGMKHAFGRALAQVITDLTLLIGYIMAGFDKKKRALHDRIAGTLVIAK